MYHNYVDALISAEEKDKALDALSAYWGGMLDEGADTFWELYNPENPNAPLRRYHRKQFLSCMELRTGIFFEIIL